MTSSEVLLASGCQLPLRWYRAALKNYEQNNTIESWESCMRFHCCGQRRNADTSVRWQTRVRRYGGLVSTLWPTASPPYQRLLVCSPPPNEKSLELASVEPFLGSYMTTLK